MLKKYRTIIYESEGEINKVIDNCINHVLKNHPECTKEEILESIIKNKSDILNYDFTNELLMTEGKMLFDIAAAKFGEKLWNSNVELDNTCKKLCPFGDMCNQYFVEIEGEHICYGQMLQMQINMKSLQTIAIEKQVKIIKPNDFLRRPKAAERRKWAVASDDRLARMEQKRMEREKEDMNSDQKTRS